MSTSDTSAAPSQRGPRFSIRVLQAMAPQFFFGQYAGLTRGLREFVWLGMLFVYPVWLVSLLAVLVLYALVVAVLWVLFLPLRLYMRAAHKGSYARPEGQG